MQTPESKILIDCGISGKQTERSLAELGVSLDEIDAVLVSHEHGDHIRGLKVLALRKGIPVLANHDTAKAITEEFRRCPTFKIFTTGESFEFQDLYIHPFSIPHDTVDPVMFSIRVGDRKLGICTDLGHVTALVRHQLQQCDLLYIEANHDPQLVQYSRRPPLYKQRVLGPHGHLSNEACGKLLYDVMHEQLRYVYLAHLSEECNRPEKALETVRSMNPHMPQVTLEVALPNQQSPIAKMTAQSVVHH